MEVRLIRFFRAPEVPMPCYVHTVGCNKQSLMSRPEGFFADQLLFVRNGQGIVRVKGRGPFRFGPMQYMLLPAGVPHEYFPAAEEPWEVGYISIAGEKVRPLMEHFGIEALQVEELRNEEWVWGKLIRIWEHADANAEGAQWDAVRLLYEMLLEMNRLRQLGNTQRQPSKAFAGEASTREIVRTAAAYLQEHYNEIISVSNVASSLGCSHQYLNRLFRQAYGMSMLQFVQKIRMEKAKEMLSSEEKLTVKAIAGRLGMETNYFIRIFRKSTGGVTPEQYRSVMKSK